MPTLDPVRRHQPLLYAAAVLLTALTVFYGVAWMYYVRQPGPQVEIGIDEKHTPNGTLITTVHRASPAEGAGLKANDFITGINGVRANSALGWSSLMFHTWLKAKPGDKVVLSIQRSGQAQPLTVTPVFRPAEGAGDTKGTIAYAVGRQIIDSYPVFFAVVGFTVLFLRIEDRSAWLLALVFTTWITGGPMPSDFAAAPSALTASLMCYRTVTSTLLTGLFYFFFAVFPRRSPIDLKAPWLKWLFLACNICLGYGGFRHGGSEPLPFLTAILPAKALQVADDVTGYGALLLGMLSLVLNIWRAPDVTDRRKLKVILGGTVVGVTPIIALYAFINYTGFHSPFWVSFVCVFLMILFPLSFAYAVVKHRVMDIPVLLKRSARYFVVERGFFILILALSIGLTLWFGQAFSRYFSGGSRAAIPIGATFGVLVISGATQVHRRVRTRLDRAFFRSSYDTQQILEDLVARTLTVTNREDLAELLQQKISDALHPSSMFVYLKNGSGQFFAYAGNPPAEAMTLSPKAEVMAALAERVQPLEVSPEDAYGPQMQRLQAECLVPIRGSSEGELQGGMVLGTRLSEEPYSASDKRLLASVASQAGIAMRSITLAEKMAERMEAERRAHQEMQIAQQVQSRLLPQQAPSLKTLECAGRCVQTRAVGGDYYDFLDLGSGRLGLVLADIAGKGISGALLMANLQANLRSQYALALEDIPRLLRSVNHLFYKNTESSHYATMFFAVYNDATRQLRYVNCGHNPPILLRANGDVERLDATATVLGLFEEWDCNVVERKLASGDVLVIYTDGISEAGERDDGEGEEFGEERLLAAIRNYQHRSAEEILDGILRQVDRFSPDQQADDMTLIVGKCRD